jgi:hypothetical protein
LETELFYLWEKCSEKHRSKWPRVEGSVKEDSKVFSNLLEIATLKGDSVLNARLLKIKVMTCCQGHSLSRNNKMILRFQSFIKRLLVKMKL